MPTRPLRPLRLPVVLPVLLAALTTACGGPGDGGGAPVVTGRVMSRTAAEYCLSPDRGETTRCLPVGAAAEDLEVGQCVRATGPTGDEAARLEAAPDADCAAGDLGDLGDERPATSSARAWTRRRARRRRALRSGAGRLVPPERDRPPRTW